MVTDKWYCEACNTLGETDIDPRTDVWHAIELLGQNHNAVSPQCPLIARHFMDTAIAKMLRIVTDEKALRKLIGEIRWKTLNRVTV